MKVLIYDESPARAGIIEDGLREAGITEVTRLDSADRLLERIFAADPDLIVMDLASPQRDVLEQMFQVSRLVRRPVTMFVDQSDAERTRSAIAAGVSAYIVDGLRKERVKHIIDMCVARFQAFSHLETELAEARGALADRKVIDRAKAILMTARGLDEDAAYRLMRSTAMRQNQRIADIARAIVVSSEILG